MDRTESVKAVRAIILLAFMSAFAPALVHAQPVVVYNGPVSRAEPHPCIPGEVVSLEGSLVATVYSHFDVAGGQHLTIRFITRAEGTGVSALAPKNYKLNEESIEEWNLTANSTNEVTFVLNHVVIRKAETDSDTDVLLGTSDDYMFKETVHITMRGSVPVLTITPQPARCM